MDTLDELDPDSVLYPEQAALLAKWQHALKYGWDKGQADFWHFLANGLDLGDKGLELASKGVGLPLSGGPHQAAEWLRVLEGSVRPSPSATPPSGLDEKLLAGLGEAPGMLASFVPAVSLFGPAAGMGITEAVRASDKGVVPSLLAGTQGTLMGGAFSAASKALTPMGQFFGMGALGAAPPAFQAARQLVTSDQPPSPEQINDIGAGAALNSLLGLSGAYGAIRRTDKGWLNDWENAREQTEHPDPVQGLPEQPQTLLSGETAPPKNPNRSVAIEENYRALQESIANLPKGEEILPPIDEVQTFPNGSPIKPGGFFRPLEEWGKWAVEMAIQALSNPKQKRALYSSLPEKFISDFRTLTDTDLSGYNLVLPADAIRHAFRKHGNPRAEESRGQVAVTPEDIALLPSMLENLTRVDPGNASNNFVLVSMLPDGRTSFVVKMLKSDKPEIIFEDLWIQKAKTGNNEGGSVTGDAPLSSGTDNTRTLGEDPHLSLIRSRPAPQEQSPVEGNNPSSPSGLQENSAPLLDNLPGGETSPPVLGSGFAGNINLSHIYAPEQIHALIRETAARFAPEVQDARRGVVSWEETRKLAEELGMTEEALLERRKGQAFNAEQAVAARMILAEARKDKLAIAKAIAEGLNDDAHIVAFAEVEARHAAIQFQVSGMTAEAGRALQSFRMNAGQPGRSVVRPGVEPTPAGERPGVEPAPAGERPGVEPAPAGERPGVEPAPAGERPGVEPAPAGERPGVEPAPAGERPGVEPAPAGGQPSTQPVVKSPAATNAQKALDAFAELARMSPEQRQQAIREMLNSSSWHTRRRVIEEAALEYARLEDVHQQALSSRQRFEPGFWDYLQEYRVNALLSNPPTHMANIVSNTVSLAFSIPESLVAAGISKATGSGISLREAGARIFGMANSLIDAARLAARTFQEGMPPNVEGKFEAGGFRHAFPGTAGEVIRFPGKMLMVEDVFFNTLAYRAELSALAAREAAKAGLEGEPFSFRVQQILAEPPAAMVQSAKDAARYWTFTNPLGKTGQAGQALINSHPIFRMLIPFFRTPVNIAKRALERSPLALTMPTFWAAMKKGGVERDQALARLAVGSAIAGAMVLAASNGYVSGKGPGNPKARALLRAQGWQPYSFKIGDSWVSYNRMDPLGMVVGMAADFASLVHDVDRGEADGMAAILAGSISRNLTSKTFLSGISSFIDFVSEPEKSGSPFLTNLASSYLPAIVGGAARIVDPVVRDVSTGTGGIELFDALSNRLQSRIPGLSHLLPPRLDIWGKPEIREGGLGPDFLSPLATSSIRKDPLSAELYRLQVYPSKHNRVFRGVRLEAEEYNRLLEISGQLTHQQMEAFMASPGYAAIPDHQKAFEMKRIRIRAMETAERWFLAGNPGVRQKLTAAHLAKRMERAGYGP
ncbi:MAG: hypothetical protein HQL56_18425 [Magnetococcales bacterium]|nr:hypothetical protein [Magnetococcales bacterium]